MQIHDSRQNGLIVELDRQHVPMLFVHVKQHLLTANWIIRPPNFD